MSGSINSSEFILLSSYPKAIAHIDCDAFFASCEQARDPALRGKPVITGKERGIVACASYEAKALGVKRGVSLRDAKKLCPGLITLPSDYELYSIYSERVFNILRRFTPQVEEFSIDEAFCDLTGLRRLYRASYPSIAQLIKTAVRDELDITVSAGLSITKILAKICSKKNKPDGFLAVPGKALHLFLKGVSTEEVCGFGPNTVALLSKYGIGTALDFVRRPASFAEGLLGKVGIELWRELRGDSVYEVMDAKKERYLSISKTKTFSPPSSERGFVKAQLMRNLESAFIKLRRHGLYTREVAVYLRRQDFTGDGLRARVTRHSSSTLDFTELCAGLFDRLFEGGTQYRATGVILSGIIPETKNAADLFDDPVRIEEIRRLSLAVDAINTQFGKHTVHLASSHAANIKGDHIRNEPAWRKQELLKGETTRRRLNIPLLKLRLH